MTDDLGARLAATVQHARTARGLTVAALAEESGVSRAMIAKIERAQAQPTAALLSKLSGALGLTLSELIARTESDTARLTRRDEQPVWVDPQTSYVRRAVSPPSSASLELVDVMLPPGAQVASPAETYRFIDQLIWVTEGRLRFVEGDLVHELDPGDCLHLGPPADCVFVNPTDLPCRYLVALEKLTAPRRSVPS